MAGTRIGQRTVRLGLAIVVAGGLLAAVGGVPAQAAAGSGQPPPLPHIQGSRGAGVLAFRKTPVRKSPPAFRAREVSWPAAATAVISMTGPSPVTASGNAAQSPFTGGSVAHGAGTPVWAQPAAGRGGHPSSVRVRVLSQAAALAAGVHGVVFTAAPGSGSGGGRVRLGLSYSGFAQASGGNYGPSLGLVEMPACALTTPASPACRKETPLPSVNDPAAQTVSAPVAVGGMVVLAATTAFSDGGGAAGTYNATSLRASGTWSEGGSSGSFTYSYPLAVPPAPSSLAPSLSLSYDSGAVDGQTAATQAQAPWIGDGWTLGGGTSFVEQSFTACQDNPEGSAAPQATPDQCYDGPVLTLSQGGSSAPLVCPVPFSYTAASTCTASADNGEVVTHHVSSGNGQGTRFTDYWTVTTRDGTTYYYGLNHLPGWASGNAATNSTDSVPVFSAHSGDPCYNATWSASVCTMAYRWNLDYVKDLHGNAMAYYYTQDANAYAENGSTSSAVSYVRDSHLDHIDYGFTDGNAYTGHAPDQVVFTPGDRCVSGTCDPLNAANAPNWPDVPYTQDYCAAGASCQVTAPTFWSTVRLAKVATQQWNGTAYAPADTWTLAHSFPATGDGTSPALWLASVTRTGGDTTAGGSSVSLPPVSFTPVQLGNRVNPNNYPALDRNRISQITTETGSVISVTYTQPAACSPSSPPSPSANTQSCFPVYWQQFTPPNPDWFIKYAVQSVSVSDPAGGSPGLYTSYAYSGPAWHYDDNEVVKAKYRTWGQWRGYHDVKTYTGTGGDAQTETEDTYYQGMSDDNNTTAVTLTDSQGGQHDDANQLASAVLESTAYDYKNGPADHSAIHSYWVSAAAATRTRTGLPDLTANFTGPVEDWTRQAITDGGTTTWRKTETDTSYDATTTDHNFGLPQFVFAHGDLSQPAQQTCTSYTYAPANTSENLAGLPAETETDAAACGGSNPGGASAPGAGQVNALTAPAGISRPAGVISDTRTFYDNPALAQTWPQPASPAWPQATPTKGEVSVVRQATDYASGAFTYQTKTATVYDSYGRPVTTYDADGNMATTSYTMTNGVTTSAKVTNPLSQAVTTTYDPLRGLPTTMTDANGIATTMHYDGLGRLIDVWEYNRATSSPANYIFSYAISRTAPSVVTTQKLNDESLYVTSTSLYDSLLRPRQTQQPTPQLGVLVTDHFYDSRGWEWKTNHDWWYCPTNPGSQSCLASAIPGSSVLTVPDSQVHDQDVTAFDGLGRPVQVTSYDDSAVKSVAYTQHTGDKVTTVTTGATTGTSSGATPTTVTTDALGRRTELDSYTSLPSVSTGTAGGFPTVTITGGTSQATGYAYNTRGWLSAVTDNSTSQQWTRGYNLLGQVTSTTSPNSGTTTMSYDPAGNLAATTDQLNHTISYAYDALNRKTAERDGPSASSPLIASWVYDNSNNVSGVTDPIGHLTTETSYSGGNAYVLQEKGFNAFGESLGQTVTLPAAEGALAGSYTLTHLYSSVTGLLSRDSYPASPLGTGQATPALPAENVIHGYKSGFDLPAAVKGLAQYATDTTYTAFSQVARQTIGNTTNYAYVTSSYDPHTGALTDAQTENTAVSTTPFDDTSYNYDPAGNITAQTDTRYTPATGTQAETQCYTYDALDRLTQAWTTNGGPACSAGPSTGTGGTVGDGIPGGAYWTTWAYDPLGDQQTQTQHSVTGGTNTVTTYSYNGNGASQPDTLTGTSTTGPGGTTTGSYAYDAEGNTLTRTQPGGNQTLTWTDDGKLATDTTSAGTASYIYDADGHLLLQKDPGQVTLHLFGDTQQITLNTGTGAITGTRIMQLPGGGGVVRTGSGSSYNFELTDQHGTSLLTLSSTAQSPVWRQYTPYGAPRGTAPPSWPDNNAFLGKPADTPTGLDLIGARAYDPATGRFLSVDPVFSTSDPQTMAGYSYAAGNPVTHSDPTGLSPTPSACQFNITLCLNQEYQQEGGQYNAQGIPTGVGISTAICYYCRDNSDYPTILPHAVARTPDYAAQALNRAIDLQRKYGVNYPGCSGRLFNLGACPSEAGAAGTTPEEVKQSLIGAGMILLSAIPVGDIFDAVFGGGTAVEGTATATERSIAVIGRLPDTDAAKGWAGHEVLDLPQDQWSIARNDQWVQSVIDRKMNVYVASNSTWENMWDAVKARSTVFGRELSQFTNAGYTWDGWTMIPPGGG